MANIDRIVNVQIQLQTAGVTQATFSDLMLFGKFTIPVGDTGNVFIITDPSELIDTYGVSTSDKIYSAAQVFFSQIPHPPQLYIGFDDTANDAPTNLTTIARQNNDWYGICDVEHDETRALDIAAWAEAEEKIFVTVLSSATNSSDPGTDTSSIAYQLMNGNYFRTAWWYDSDPTEYPDVGIASKSFTKYPGQETWANQRLNAVDSTFLTETVAQNVFAKNGNTFEPFRNINITQNGKVAGGEWIDVIRFRDWLCEEIKVNIFLQFVDNRIPFTDPGIAIIRSRLQQSLDRGVARGGIAPKEVDADGNVVPSYTISVPLSMSVPTNDKANRILHDVYFTARLAGAIHAVWISGTLTYESLPVASPNSAVNNAARVTAAQRATA